MGNIWETAKTLSIQTGKDIVGGFDIGFESKIPDSMKDALMRFVYWVEDRYYLPITLWVDFRYNHYLVGCDKKRVGYRFYHVDYESLSSFDSFDDIPVIELAVRCEKQTMDEVLRAFTEAITCYFAWLSGLDLSTFKPDEKMVTEILEEYQNTRGE